MKKFAALMIGMSLMLGTAAFAQDDKKMDDKKTEKKTKKVKKAKKPAADADKKM